MDDLLLPLQAYCDGSGGLADGPACVGVVVADASGRILCESSAFLRTGTSNVAEILAIRRALWLVGRLGPLGERTPAVVHSDSEYAIGFVTGSWGIYPRSKNGDLSPPMRRQWRRHEGAAELRHVRGHAGVAGNELADWLAWRARRDHMIALGVVREDSTRRRRPVQDHVLELAPRPAPKPKKPKKD